MLKPLPVGIQTFGAIVRGGFLYVDKTRWIHDLVRYPIGTRGVDPTDLLCGPAASWS